MYQQIVLIGNVGNKDPEPRKTPSGIPVCNFSMATNRTYTDARGEKHTKTVWFRVTAWHKLAEIVIQHVKAGRRVLVVGEVELSEPFQAGDGTWKANIQVKADVVRALDRAENGDYVATDFEPMSELGDREIPFRSRL